MRGASAGRPRRQSSPSSSEEIGAHTGWGRLLNIGTGIETSVNDLYQVMAASVDGPEEPSRESGKTGEIRRSALNPAGAIEALDWSPSTKLAAGVAETLTWFADRK